MEDPAVAQLTELGYSVSDAVAALERCRGSVREAHLHLYGLLCERAAAAEAGVAERVPGSHEAVEGVDEGALWSEEAEALQAIFGEESVATGEEGSGCPFVQYEAAEQDNGPRVTLRLSRLPGSGGSAYPHAIPLISIRCAGNVKCVLTGVGSCCRTRKARESVFKLSKRHRLACMRMRPVSMHSIPPLTHHTQVCGTQADRAAAPDRGPGGAGGQPPRPADALRALPGNCLYQRA